MASGFSTPLPAVDALVAAAIEQLPPPPNAEASPSAVVPVEPEEEEARAMTLTTNGRMSRTSSTPYSMKYDMHRKEVYPNVH